jgi:hypothetical protein
MLNLKYRKNKKMEFILPCIGIGWIIWHFTVERAEKNVRKEVKRNSNIGYKSQLLRYDGKSVFTDNKHKHLKSIEEINSELKLSLIEARQIADDKERRQAENAAYNKAEKAKQTLIANSQISYPKNSIDYTRKNTDRTGDGGGLFWSFGGGDGDGGGGDGGGD